MNLSSIREIPVIEVATRLGIQVRGTKAMCFSGHDKNSPSLSFHKAHNTWRCFGACGKHGDTIALVMEKEGVDFKSAVEWLAQNFAIDVEPGRRGQRRQTRSCITKKSTIMAAPLPESEYIADPELYAWFISKCDLVTSAAGIKYLDSHGISSETAQRFNIRQLSKPGYALQKLVETWGEQRVCSSGIAWCKDGHADRLIWNSYALLFPFYNDGQITYIQARMIGGDKKFLNLRGIVKPLFNIDRLSGLQPGHTVHLCEGVPDAIALESQNLIGIGILGATSFRAEWVDRFLKFRVIVLGDGDQAGAKFASDISRFFMERGKPVQCMSLPKGKDVADVLAQGGSAK